MSIEIVRGDHFRDLVLVEARLPLEEARGCEMARLSVAPCERVVRDALDERLQEAVLAPLRRARVGLDREQLLAHERVEDRLELDLGDSGDRRQTLLRERLAEHGCVLEHVALLRFEPVQPRSDQGVQRLGHLERLDRTADAESVALTLQQAAVEQHPDGLDGVQRDAVRPLADRRPDLVGEPRDEPAQQRLHRLVAERLERERGRATDPRPERRVPLAQLGPRERQHVDRVAPRPVEQVLDEVEERRVGPVQVLEQQHHRPGLRHALEEEAPGRVEIFAVGGDSVGEAEDVLEARLDPLALVRVGHVPLDRPP